MTSQVILFEWYLNRKFKQYFANVDYVITIDSARTIGTPLFFGTENINDMVLYQQSEGVQEPTVLYYDGNTVQYDKSFVVEVPYPNTNLIEESVYIANITYYINKYRLTNKTFEIKYIS
jgi:hypothetical protein